MLRPPSLEPAVVAALSLLSGLSVVPLVLEIISLVQLNVKESKLFLAEGSDELLG